MGNVLKDQCPHPVRKFKELSDGRHRCICGEVFPHPEPSLPELLCHIEHQSGLRSIVPGNEPTVRSILEHCLIELRRLPAPEPN